jgi:hypothetical protein
MMRRQFQPLLLPLCALVALLSVAPTAQAQFGVARPQQDQEEQASSLLNGVPEQQQAEDSHHRLSPEEQGDFMSQQDAVDIAQIVQTARSDPETMMLVDKMKREMPNELKELREAQSKDSIMLEMKQAMDELKMLDVLFKDPARAVEEMAKEGMIDKNHIKKYRKNPELLEDDTRKGMYFQFVSLAVIGEFI